jgi:hypothetical protein
MLSENDELCKGILNLSGNFGFQWFRRLRGEKKNTTREGLGVNSSAQAESNGNLHGYRRQVCEHSCEKVKFAFTRAFVEWDAMIDIRALYECIDQQGQCAHVYFGASRIGDWGCTATCTRLGWIERTGRGRGVK